MQLVVKGLIHLTHWPQAISLTPRNSVRDILYLAVNVLHTDL